MKIDPAYISIGVNRSSSCAVCTSTGILAFGAGPYVALWDTKSADYKGVYATLPGHKGQVTTVKLISEEDGRAKFITGDTEGNVRLWSQTDERNFRCDLAFEAHPSSTISALGVSPTSPGRDQVLFTGASDGLVRVWKLQGAKVEEMQKVENKARLPLDIEVGYLPGSTSLVIIVGYTDKRIQVYTERAGKFAHAITLEGHEDWVRCLSLTPYPATSGQSSDLLLASGSQDNYIRLWRIAPISAKDVVPEEQGEGESGLDMLDEFERKIAGEAGGNVQISTKAHILQVFEGETTKRFNVTLEALLIGHESGLTNVHWSPSPNPVLLSTASDNSLVIWTPSSDGIWVPSHRFGAIGGRGLAFYGAIWGVEGRTVMAGGWNGGWERWTNEAGAGEEDRWEVEPGLAGHHGDVKSIAWDPKGDYLVSVSSDQTSRIHASCRADEAGPSTWAEIARPQIHGYDMADIAWISPLRFASAGDEKVARVFDAPGGYVESLASLGVVSGDVTADSSSRPKGATVPPLGLSNRALGKEAAELDLPSNRISNQEHQSVSRTLTTLPTEEELATATLWPEVEKVYGHGYELVAIAASHDGSVVASACRASNPEHAVIRVHSTSTWDPVGQPLAGHSLTITRIAFSHDDQRVLSVSRDRGWRIFKRSAEGSYELEAKDERAHGRMVLDATWGEGMFASASRDKTVKIWKEVEGVWTTVDTIKLNEPATAVDLLPRNGQDSLLAVGTESGAVSIHAVSSDGTVKHLTDVSAEFAHAATVNRLAWRPASAATNHLQLASCADDRSVRIFDISP